MEAGAGEEPAASPWVDRAVLALCAVSALALAWHTISEQDIFWQIAAGRWVLACGWPDVDPFSWWLPHQPWIELRWLWGVAVAWLCDLGGAAALTTVTAAAIVACVLLAAGIGAGARGWATCVGAGLAVLLGHPRFVVRPETATFLFVCVALTLLERFRRGGSPRALWFLCALQVLWVNTHTLFVLGPVLTWAFVAAEWLGPRALPVLFDAREALAPARLRQAALVAVATSLACLVNPWFLRGATFPLTLFRQIREGDRLKHLIAEFRGPLELGLDTPYVLTWLGALALVALAFAARGRRASPSSAVITLAFAYLSALAARNVALFGLVGGFYAALHLSEWSRGGGRLAPLAAWVTRAAATSGAVLAVAAMLTGAYQREYKPEESFGLGFSTRRFPVRALEFLRREGLPRRLVNGLGDGGYVLYEGGPQSVFVDGRLEVYGGAAVERAVAIANDGARIEALSQETGVRTALLRHPMELDAILQLAARPEWVAVYYDPTHVVFVRRGGEVPDARLDALAIDWKAPRRPAPVDAPASWPGPRRWEVDALDCAALGELLFNLGAFDAAREQFARSLELDADSELAQLYLGVFALADGDEARGRALLAEVRASAREERLVQLLVGRVHEGAGRLEAALAALERALAAGATGSSVHTTVARVALALGRNDRAATALETIARSGARNPQDWVNAGVAHNRAGAADDALRCLSRALELEPRQPRVLFVVGQLQARRGNLPAARAAWERSLALDPSQADVRESLARLPPN